MKFAKNCKGVKYLLVRSDLFDRTVDEKGMEAKVSTAKKLLERFQKWLEKRINQLKIELIRLQEMLYKLKTLHCKAEGIEIYSAVMETEAAFADSKTSCVKSVDYFYMDHYGYRCHQKLSQFVTTLAFRKTCSTEVIPKNVKTSAFLSILVTKPLR